MYLLKRATGGIRLTASPTATAAAAAGRRPQLDPLAAVASPGMLRACLCSALLSAAAAQFGNIRIDWVSEGALGDGLATPRIVGLQAEEEELRAAVQAQAPAPSADTYEDAWWKGGFEHEPPDTWFAGSREPRGKRHPEMIRHGLRVGAVYTHMMTGARGVIVGWDEKPRAPRQWLSANLPGERSWADRMRRLYSPHFSVLEELTSADGNVQFMQRYIVAQCREDNPAPCPYVEPLAKPLQHPDLGKFFDGFDAHRGYLPNEALASLYPDG